MHFTFHIYTWVPFFIKYKNSFQTNYHVKLTYKLQIHKVLTKYRLTVLTDSMKGCIAFPKRDKRGLAPADC